MIDNSFFIRIAFVMRPVQRKQVAKAFAGILLPKAITYWPTKRKSFFFGLSAFFSE